MSEQSFPNPPTYCHQTLLEHGRNTAAETNDPFGIAVFTQNLLDKNSQLCPEMESTLQKYLNN